MANTRWAKSGVRVNCLVPGCFVDKFIIFDHYSERVPMGRMAESDEMVPALLYSV